MGLLDAITGRQQPQAPPAPKAHYTPTAQQYIAQAKKIADEKTAGAIDPADAAKLTQMMEGLGDEDLRSMRRVGAERMRGDLSPSMKDANPQISRAAKNLVNMIDNGVLPGLGGGPTVFIESGKIANGAEVEAAKRDDSPKGWAPK